MNPKQKLEQAVHTWLAATPITGIASTSIYKGVDNPLEVDSEENAGDRETKVHPSVTIEAEGQHEEFIPFSNVFLGALSVTVEADAFNTKDTDFDTLCTAVFDRFNIVELAAEISASLATFTVQFAQVTSIGSSVNNGTNWQAIMTIDMAYSESDHA